MALSLIGGVALFASFVLYERRASHPMLPLGLFARRNFTAGNIETFAMYGGLSIVFFLMVLFLQGVAGFSALAAGSASIPVTLVMFALAARFGRLADRHGPRLFMGIGPLVSAVGPGADAAPRRGRGLLDGPVPGAAGVRASGSRSWSRR